MAHIIINTRANHAKYEDGDILDVRSDSQIKRCHAEMICNRKFFERNGQGCLIRDTLAEEYYLKTHQYKFERQGSEIVRTNLFTGQVDIIGKDPRIIDGKLQSKDVNLYLERRLRHANNKIFGSIAHAVWYGGRVREDKVDELWDRIEAETPKRKADHDFYPYSPNEKKHYLAIPVLDFDEKERERMTEPLYDVDERTGDFKLNEEEQRIVEKQKRVTFKWREVLDILKIRETDVLDKEKVIDLSSEIKLNPTQNRERKQNAKERRDNLR